MRDTFESLPENFTNLEEFWDTHSSAHYEDHMEAVASSETLINLWLQEQLGAVA